jgi:Tfp pilus assembly protein PilN
VVDSDVELAKGAEKVLVSAYTERRDYVKMVKEMMTLIEGTGGWYTYIEGSSNGNDSAGGDNGGKAITLKGLFRTKEALAAFNERIESASTIKEADTVEIKQVRRYDGGKYRSFWHFVITANLVDTIPPFVSDPSAAPANKTSGTTVSDGGADDLTLSLGSIDEAVAKKRKAKAAPTPAAPQNPFDVAATVAAGSGS